MTKDLMITMLKKGETGDEILMILESISTDSDETASNLDEIKF